MVTTTINGTEYPLATTLRVAYKVQGQHNHAPYTQVFEKLGEMTLEDQIGILYAAFEVANPEQAKFITKKAFLDEYLDNYNLTEVMDQLKAVVEGIMGKKLDTPSEDVEPVAQGE